MKYEEWRAMVRKYLAAGVAHAHISHGDIEMLELDTEFCGALVPYYLYYDVKAERLL